jgi:hypothetical protein
MHTLQLNEEQEFWSDVYRGRSIAIFNHHGRWHVYLDHILQRAQFQAPEDAILWLTERIDQGLPARLN